MLPAVTRTGTDAGQPPAPGPPSMISAGTLRRLELAAGDLAAACLAAMEQRQPWFARLPADQRAGVRLVTQTGVANFVAWLGERGETIRLTAEAFRIAPHDLARRLSLRQTVDLVRIATDVFERHLPPLATDEAERRALVEGVLRFGREIAFAAATVYAGAAETRGAWDARLEALVVDAVVRGPHVEGGADDALVSRAAALGWDPAAAVRVVAGSPAPDAPAERLAQLRLRRRPGRPIGAGRGAGQPADRAAVRAGPAGPGDRTSWPRSCTRSGPARWCSARPAADLAAAHASARDALSGLRAARGWPAAPRPVAADDLLPERALAGDAAAHRRLVEAAIEPLDAAGGELLTTLACYLEGGGGAGVVRPHAVRAPEHGALPAAPGRRAHRAQPDRPAGRAGAALRADRGPARQRLGHELPHNEHRTVSRAVDRAIWRKPPNPTGRSWCLPISRGPPRQCCVTGVIALLAPGQGSQTPGMLAPWLDDPAAEQLLAAWSDAIVARPAPARHRGVRRGDQGHRGHPAAGRRDRAAGRGPAGRTRCRCRRTRRSPGTRSASWPRPRWPGCCPRTPRCALAAVRGREMAAACALRADRDERRARRAARRGAGRARPSWAWTRPT